MWLMDEVPVLGILQRDSHFQVTWQGHWGKIISFSVAVSPCKSRQNATLHHHCLAILPLALVPVAEKSDFCFCESQAMAISSSPDTQQLCGFKQMQRRGQEVGPAVFVFLYHTGLRAWWAATAPTKDYWLRRSTRWFTSCKSHCTMMDFL